MLDSSLDINKIQPKVIPLIRNESNSQKKEPKSEAKETDESKPAEKLTLLDLISKMQEKLINAPATSSMVNTQAQQMLSAISDTKPKQSSEKNTDYVNIENIHDNVSYHLWQFDTVKIIIRLSIDGYVNTESSSLNVITHLTLIF